MVRYEDLVANPTDVAAEIYAFVGEAPLPDLLDRLRAADHPMGLGDNKIYETAREVTAKRAKQGSQVPAHLRNYLAGVCNATLELLGYEAL